MEKKLSNRHIFRAFIFNNILSIISLIIALFSLGFSMITNSESLDSSDIRMLITKEARASLEGDVEGAISLYHPEAVVRDWGSSDPYGPHPRMSWQGFKEIRERYKNLPHFTRLKHMDVNVVEIRVLAGTARAESSSEGTISIRNTVSDLSEVRVATFRGDIWEFRKVNQIPFMPWTGEWKVASFTYDCSR